MESFTIDLVLIASAQLFPDNTFSLFTKLSPEQLNLEDELEMAISEFIQPSVYQNITERKFNLFDENFSQPSEFFHLEAGLDPPLRMLLKQRTFSFKKTQSFKKQMMDVVLLFFNYGPKTHF